MTKFAGADMIGKFFCFLAELAYLSRIVSIRGKEHSQGFFCMEGLIALQGDLSVATDVWNGDIPRPVVNVLVLPMVASPFPIDQVPVAFPGFNGTAGGAESSFPMIHCVLHFRTKLLAHRVHISSMNYISIIHKNATHQVNSSKRESTNQVKAKAHCFHHVNDDGAESNVGSGSTAVALSDGLERDIAVFSMRLCGVSLSSPNFVRSILKSAIHGKNGVLWSADALHTEHGHIVNGAIVTRFSFVCAKCASLPLLS